MKAIRIIQMRGFSLVELMIGLVLGLLVTGALISAFTGIRAASGTTTGVASLADSGRAALDSIQQSIRSAGFMACNNTLRQISDLNPDAGGRPIFYDFSQPLGGYEGRSTAPGNTLTLIQPVAADSTASDWTSTAYEGGNLDALLVGKVVKGSDVLVVHENFSDAQAVLLATQATPGSTSLSVSNLTGTGIKDKQLAVISNCTQSEVFQISGLPSSNTIQLTNLAMTPGNASALQLPYGPGSRVSIVDEQIYFIGVGADGDAALFLASTNGNGDFSPPTELVPDIENMQVLYGIDTTGTQTIGQYVTADQVPTLGITKDFNSVLSVQVALLAAGPLNSAPARSARSYSLLGTTVSAPNDTRLRQVFSFTASLRNMSP